MSDPNWERYEKLEKAYNDLLRQQTFELFEIRKIALIAEIACFLLKPYWDLKKEKENAE